jgi:Protein of unknown function (DUF2892).
MCNDRIIRRFAGSFVLASLALGWFVNPLWLLFTAFVGLNLLQSSFTQLCPLERILGRLRALGCTSRAVSPSPPGEAR